MLTDHMFMKGYLPAGDYAGIMSLNEELRGQNKRLRAELISVQVEHERLRMEEMFLRESAVKAGHTPPPEVPLRSHGVGHAGAVMASPSRRLTTVEYATSQQVQT